MAQQDRPEQPRLTVIDSLAASPEPKGFWRTFVDGSAEIAIGAGVGTGFGIEAAKSVMTGDTTGRWWFFAASLAGIALTVSGFWLRERLRKLELKRRQVRIGIVVTAADPSGSLAYAQRVDAQAERYSRARCAVTIKSDVRLPPDGTASRELIDALGDRTIEAMAIAEQLLPDAVGVDLIPTMRLHVAFWYGARLGHTHARGVMVHELLQGNGNPSHFPAVPLKVEETLGGPLDVHALETIDGGDPTVTALAVDLQAWGETFIAPVRKTCKEKGIGNLLHLSSPINEMPSESLASAVGQICRVWSQANLSKSARTGRHAVFLSGPVAIAVALGARLASNDHGRWTAYTYNRETSDYVHFPPIPST
ncbi:SAVED domain-containing protein [Actinomadura sp. NPDC048955]|uniref:SAVED domain-containing protein n=1 Tax=Actinomadura sp. NPDC048955 TaxID=3158228 RepID=UPI0033EF82D4